MISTVRRIKLYLAVGRTHDLKYYFIIRNTKKAIKYSAKRLTENQYEHMNILYSLTFLGLPMVRAKPILQKLRNLKVSFLEY